MKQIISLIKINYKKGINIFLGSGDTLSKSLGMLCFIMIYLVASEALFARLYSAFKVVGQEYILVSGLFNMGFIFGCIASIRGVINNIFLGSDYKYMSIYPIKKGVYILGKSIGESLGVTLIPVVLSIQLLTYGFYSKVNYDFYLGIILFIILVFGATLFITYVIIGLVYIYYNIKNLINKLIIGFTLNIVVITIITLNYFERLINQSTKFDFISNFIYSGEIYRLLPLASLGISLTYVVCTIVLIGCGMYFHGEDMYIDIMKKNIERSKGYRGTTDQYKYYPNTKIVSNIIRDLKLIWRVPILRTNIIITTGVVFVISTTLLIICVNSPYIEVIKSIAMVGIIVILGGFTLINFAAITSFTREGRGLEMFKVYPIKISTLILSKVILALGINSLGLITCIVIGIVFSSSYLDIL
ncbi:MAG: hypothetical protein RSC49_06835, partial [Clostridium sp.]